jgi:prolyl 4-hydroxylase
MSHPAKRAHSTANERICLQAREPGGHKNDAKPREKLGYGAGQETWAGAPQILSWQPMVVLYEDFLTTKEREYLLNLATPHFEPAMLVSLQQHAHIRHQARTSQGAFFDTDEDPVISSIVNRLSNVARLDPGANTCALSSLAGTVKLMHAESASQVTGGDCAETMEPWQVMKYELGEQYSPHVDYYDRPNERFFGYDAELFGGQRIKTALMYLTSATGGETVFRNAAKNNTVGEKSCAGR